MFAPTPAFAAGDQCGAKADPGLLPQLQTAWWWFWSAQGPTDVGNTPATVPYHIIVDTFTSTLTLFHHGLEVRQFPVAVGKAATPTPPGEWTVTNQSRNWGGGFGTRWNGINVPWGIYGIHGTNAPHAIGSHVSAGCIRMFNQDVEELYDTIPLGTPVTTYGPLPRVARRQLIQGGSGKFMLVLQVRLRQAGFEPGPIDGRFGQRTEAAILNLNGFYGLPPEPALNQTGQQLIGFPQ